MTSHENNEAGDVRDEDAETPPPVDRLTRNAPIGGGANAQPSAFPPATMDALLDEVDTLRERLATTTANLDVAEQRMFAAEQRLAKVGALADEWEVVGKYDRAAKRAHDKLRAALSTERGEGRE